MTNNPCVFPTQVVKRIRESMSLLEGKRGNTVKLMENRQIDRQHG